MKLGSETAHLSSHFQLSERSSLFALRKNKTLFQESFLPLGLALQTYWFEFRLLEYQRSVGSGLVSTSAFTREEREA